MRETELGKTGGGVGLVAEPVPRLLSGGAVIAETIGLDHQAEIGPVEVDFEAVYPRPCQRRRQASLTSQRKEAAFELLLGTPR